MLKTKIKISIITPFFKGNPYMPAFRSMILRNAETIQESELVDSLTFEVVMVNDSPGEEVMFWEVQKGNQDPSISGTVEDAGDPSVSDSEKDSLTSSNYEIGKIFQFKLVQNRENQGIQRSRIHGLKEASGEYIVFLDQDDILSDDAVLRFGKAALDSSDHKKPFIYVANAILEQKDWKSLWYRTDYHKKQVGNRATYLNIGTQIISPGQCLIPRKWIPDFWITHPLMQNGADDFFLWILLLEAGVEFRYIDKALYIHHYTAKNLSGDTRLTDQSTYEFIDLIHMELESSQLALYPIGKSLYLPVRQTIRDLKRLKRMMTFKANFRQGSKACKVKQILNHPCLFIQNILFKIRSKTGYGFNR